MKLFSDIAKQMLPKNQSPVLVHCISHFNGVKYLKEPIMSDQVKCIDCGGSVGYHCLVDPKTSDERMWCCYGPECIKVIKKPSGDIYKPVRALDWEEFCACNSLGDLCYDIRFEKVNQSKPKIDFMRSFADKPQGLLIMQGKPRTGKTYCALGLCELFTRKSASCIYQTHKNMLEDYFRNIQSKNSYNFRDRLSSTSLLVIDDFGVVDPSPGFMAYFMDILNARMQWSNKGTVIATSLEGDHLSKIAGESLANLFHEAQFFKFDGEKRRQRVVL